MKMTSKDARYTYLCRKDIWAQVGFIFNEIQFLKVLRVDLFRPM